MRKRLTVGGSTLRPRDDTTKARIASELHAAAWPLLERGGTEGIEVVIDSVFPLASAADAHRRMESSQHVGKIALTCA